FLSLVLNIDEPQSIEQIAAARPEPDLSDDILCDSGPELDPCSLEPTWDPTPTTFFAIAARSWIPRRLKRARCSFMSQNRHRTALTVAVRETIPSPRTLKKMNGLKWVCKLSSRFCATHRVKRPLR